MESILHPLLNILGQGTAGVSRERVKPSLIRYRRPVHAGAGRAGGLLRPSFGDMIDVVRDGVRFPLGRVPGLADRQACLDSSPLEKS
ncbi:MAG TPA: hypothetical protein VMC09_11555 [Anaerolineales bacterium]|nr:hypothetical protein [Anaerolineales bacterium]